MNMSSVKSKLSVKVMNFHWKYDYDRRILS